MWANCRQAAMATEGDAAVTGLLGAEGAAAFAAAALAGCVGVPLDLSGGAAALTAREIHGGNLNFAFAVEDGKGGAVFVKQAPDFIKVFGPEAKLERERILLEHKAFEEWRRALGEELVAQYFPRIYVLDEGRMAFIMDFLGSFKLLQESLFEGDTMHQAVAESLGRGMALMHARTHSSRLPAAETARLGAAFANGTMRDIQLEYVFSKCFREDPRAEYLRADAAFMDEVEQLKASYKGAEKDDLALVHGDLHAGSVMADSSGSVRLIDPEFAIYGPPGLDVGSLLSTYALAFCFRTVVTGAIPESLLEAIGQIWSTYIQVAAEEGVPEVCLRRCGELAVGFAGCEVSRTALGFAGERSLRISDAEVRAKAELGALRVGERCIRGRAGGGPEVLVAELRAFAAAILAA